MPKIITLQTGEEACISPVFEGFANGFGVFETMKLSGGKLCFWDAHWKRFSRSARALGIEADIIQGDVMVALRRLVQAESLHEGTLKISLLREGEDSQCYVYSRPSTSFPKSICVQLSEDILLNEHSLLAGHKTHNYMENKLLIESARKNGFFEVIRLNTAGILAEAASSNLFFIQDFRLYTPAVSTGILPGVVRAEVIEAAKSLSIPVEEGSYSVETLKKSEAVFLTNSSVGILSVDRIDSNAFSIELNPRHSIVDNLKISLANVEEQNSTILINE